MASGSIQNTHTHTLQSHSLFMPCHLQCMDKRQYGKRGNPITNMKSAQCCHTCSVNSFANGRLWCAYMRVRCCCFDVCFKHFEIIHNLIRSLSHSIPRSFSVACHKRHQRCVRKRISEYMLCMLAVRLHKVPVKAEWHIARQRWICAFQQSHIIYKCLFLVEQYKNLEFRRPADAIAVYNYIGYNKNRVVFHHVHIFFCFSSSKCHLHQFTNITEDLRIEKAVVLFTNPPRR